MAFHFNWSPLIADTDRVRHMLTSSLNRTPKPPIIVDDIIVNELNLGQTPPSLEILEIGDLAEDRFRGIFKVKYEGDAYLQLRTKVQANPLNTFLSTKPGFASPGPLAAGSGLTIPLQITLSAIRLSGFVILVFNKQKGITLVFRNDPLESLKVSSTFDSIPFVRDYLQRTIEEQLRVLFMEDLPVIIHKLSLRVFDPDNNPVENAAVSDEQLLVSRTEGTLDQRTQDIVLGSTMLMSPPALDGVGDSYASFSTKNILRLAALTESQKTLSLFTPGLQETVFRAWTTAHDRSDQHQGTSTPPRGRTSLSRIQSQLSLSHSGWSSNTSQASDVPSQVTRHSHSNLTTATHTYSLQSSRSQARGARKKKHRVVNLRKAAEGGADSASDAMSVSSGYAESASRSGSVSASGSTGATSPVATSTQPTTARTRSEVFSWRDGEVHTPITSPTKKRDTIRKHREDHEVVPLATEISNSGHATLKPRLLKTPRHERIHFTLEDDDATPKASMFLAPAEPADKTRSVNENLPKMQRLPDRKPAAAEGTALPKSASELGFGDLAPAFGGHAHTGSSGGILEQAWMMKMAREVAKRVEEEKRKGNLE